MVHIGYFIDDICLPPADLTGTCHGISFYGFTVISITPSVSSNAGGGGGVGALKWILSLVFFSVDWDTKYKFLIFKQYFGHLVITLV